MITWLLILFTILYFVIKFMERCKMCGSIREKESVQKDFLKSCCVKYTTTIVCKKCGLVKSKDITFSSF
jgi:hypothetical protein